MAELTKEERRLISIILTVPVRFVDDPNTAFGEIPVYMPQHQAENIARAIAAAPPSTPEPRAEGEDAAIGMDNREILGKMVRHVWVQWAKEQPAPKASWLMPWESLTEPDKEVDRRIGEALVNFANASYRTIINNQEHELRRLRAPAGQQPVGGCKICGATVLDYNNADEYLKDGVFGFEGNRKISKKHMEKIIEAQNSTAYKDVIVRTSATPSTLAADREGLERWLHAWREKYLNRSRAPIADLPEFAEWLSNDLFSSGTVSPWPTRDELLVKITSRWGDGPGFVADAIIALSPARGKE